MERLLDFEKEILRSLLDGKHDVLDLLRNQMGHIAYVDRKLTGAGFYLDLVLLSEMQLKRVDSLPDVKSDFVIYDLCGLLNRDKIDVGFNLFIRNGWLKALEGFVFGDELWPESIESYELFTCSHLPRDLKEISMHWRKDS
jgi:hypothetical protein